MDTAKLIELMNEDLGTEYQSIVQYVQHVATIKGPEYQGFIEELRKHLSQELEHATILAQQIDFLGGVPTTEVPEVPSEPEAKRALELDLELEERQLGRYRERISQVHQMGLPDVGEALRPLLVQTQDHVQELQGVLGR
ncbi:MAG: ferritin-like domain-containing protein [Actinomycetota bacterium]|nr:ferritin-like domain-containing protein [Actinomycetota bacterium]